MPTVNEELLDSAVRHQVYLGRYATGLVRQIVALLNEADADIVGQIIAKDPTAVRGAWSRRRLQALLDAIREINRDAYNSLRSRARQELVSLAKYESDFSVRGILTTLPIDFNIVTPSPQMLKAVVTERPIHGTLLKDWVSQLSDGRQRQIEQAIRLGLVEGETIDQMVRRVRGTRARQFKDGILEVHRRHAEAFVRTAVNHTTTMARETLYEENQDLVKGWKFVATLDSRTTPTCAALDGKVFKVGEGPKPPRHWGCRSTSSPIVKSWKELGFDLDEMGAGERASMNGAVPADTTYGEWLKRQPADVVDDVLGKTKSRLFREGNLPIDRFVDDKGKVLSLDELRVREAAAFEKAGLGAGGPPPRPTPAAARTTFTDADRRVGENLRSAGARTGTEHMQILDSDGKSLGRFSGGRSHVDIDDSTASLLNRRSGLSIHHNHPDETSLSFEDLRATSDYKGVDRILAHGAGGSTYEGRILNRTTFDRAASGLDQKIGEVFRPAANARALSQAEASQVFNHLKNRALADAGHITYNFELSRETQQIFDRVWGVSGTQDAYRSLVDKLK